MVTGMDGRGIRPSGAAPMAAPPTVYYKACIIVFMLFFWSSTRKRPITNALARRAVASRLARWTNTHRRSEPEHPNPATLHQIGPHAEFVHVTFPPPCPS